MNQRIVCAANRHKQTKQVILGIRHWDGYMRVQCLDYDYSDYEQGFIDNKGNFLTREEAFVVAEREGQIIRSAFSDEGCLYSENLY